MNELLTVDETAKFLRVNCLTLYRRVSANTIPHLRVGRKILFDPVALRAWMEPSAQPTTAKKGS